jgi:hypothetical protein
VLLKPTILLQVHDEAYPTGTVMGAVETYHTVAIGVAEPYHKSEVGDVAAGVVAGCPGSFGQRWKPANSQRSLGLEKETNFDITELDLGFLFRVTTNSYFWFHNRIGMGFQKSHPGCKCLF